MECEMVCNKHSTTESSRTHSGGRERRNSDPSPSIRLENNELDTEDIDENVVEDIVQSTVIRTDVWQVLSDSHPLPPLPPPRHDESVHAVTSTDTKVTITRRPTVSTTRTVRPRQKLSTYGRAELERLLDESERCAREKQEEIERLKDDNNRLLKEWRDTSATLAETKVTVSHLLEDKHFVSEWMKLRYDIKNWAIQHFGARMTVSLTRWFRSQNPRMDITELTRYWKEYLKSDEHRPLLVQAFVWKALERHVFAIQPRSFHLDGTYGRQPKPNGAYWAYGEQQYIATLNDDLKPRIEDIGKPELEGEIKEYLHWRVANAAFIQLKFTNYTGHNPNIPPIVRKIMNALSPFSSTGTYTYDTESRIETELRSIIAHAIRIDADMWRQKAFLYPLRPPIHRYPRFHQTSMELWEAFPDGDSTYAPPVALVISPCLVKTGNSDSERYDISTILVKSQVSAEFATTTGTKSNVEGSQTGLYSAQSSRSTAHLPDPRAAHGQQSSNAVNSVREPGQFNPHLSPKRAMSTSRRSVDMSRNPRLQKQIGWVSGEQKNTTYGPAK